MTDTDSLNIVRDECFLNPRLSGNHSSLFVDTVLFFSIDVKAG